MSDPIFCSRARAGTPHQLPAGTPLSPSGIRHLVVQIAARAGMDPESAELAALRPHDLRRSYAKMCHEGGADVDQIKWSLGHSSIQTTELYLGSIPELRMGRTAPDRIRIKSGKLRHPKDTGA